MSELTIVRVVQSVLVWTGCLLLVGYTLAGDGVIEINQVRALCGAVTPGNWSDELAW